MSVSLSWVVKFSSYAVIYQLLICLQRYSVKIKWRNENEKINNSFWRPVLKSWCSMAWCPQLAALPWKKKIEWFLGLCKVLDMLPLPSKSFKKLCLLFSILTHFFVCLTSICLVFYRGFFGLLEIKHLKEGKPWNRKKWK